MKLSVSSKTSLKKLDSYGHKFDEKLKELQDLQAKVISNPEEFKLEHTDVDFLKVARFSLNGPGTNDFYHLQRAKFTGGIFLL